MLLLAGCAGESPKETIPFEQTTPTYVTTTATEPTSPSTSPTTPENPEATKTAEIEVLSCSFQEEILPADFEVYVGRFPAVEGKVYVDLVLKVRNTCDETIDGEDISGSFKYDGKRYAMQFEVEDNAGDFANEDKRVYPESCKIVHLFYTVDRKAEEEALTVRYTALGQEREIPVAPRSQRQKKVLQVGETFRADGQYAFKVMDCSVYYEFSATGKDAVKYHVEGSNVIALTMKLQNLSPWDLDYLEGYLLAGDRPEFGTVQLEVNDYTELEDWTEPLEPDQEEIIHIWVVIPQGVSTADLIFRLNVQGDSFYCTIE